jgi:hypothetical protein
MATENTAVYQITPALVALFARTSREWGTGGEIAVYADGECSELGECHPVTGEFLEPIIDIRRQVTKAHVARWFHHITRMRLNNERTTPVTI